MNHDLPALREIFGPAYTIDWDFRRRTFRAVRRDGGGVLEDTSTEGLWGKLWADCRARLVIVRL